MIFFSFQEHHINVVHIESRKSRRSDSMYDIYMDIETDNIRLEELIKRLKKEVNSISYNDLPIPPSPATASRITYAGNVVSFLIVYVTCRSNPHHCVHLYAYSASIGDQILQNPYIFKTVIKYFR